MNFTPLNVGMLAVGILLIYAAFVDVNPVTLMKDVVAGRVGKKVDKDKYRKHLEEQGLPPQIGLGGQIVTSV